MNNARVEWLGDRTLLLCLGTGIDTVLNARVHAVAHALRAARLTGVVEIVPAYASIAVHYDPPALNNFKSDQPPGEQLAQSLLDIVRSSGDFLVRPSPPENGQIVEIPVRYGGEHGPDLADIARLAGLGESEVIARHTGGDYQVAMLGFAPGFPYLLGLDPALHTPRRANPRTRVPAGSVAIGGAQTGIYPRELPGGWQIIGRTPLTLFDPARDPPALLAPGQRVRFRSIPEFVDARENQKTTAPATASREKQAGVTVLSPGLLTSVQDGGRHGFGAIGVGRAGAMDDMSLRLANLLVGNEQDAAALEITLRGPRLRFDADALIALAGAGIDAHCAGERIPMWRPVLLRAGAELDLGGMRRGARAHLAVAGGIDLRQMLGSRGTDVNAALGPIARPLVAGDVLPCAAARPPSCDELCRMLAATAKAENRNAAASAWSLNPSPWFDASAARPIRAIAGTHFDHLDLDSRRALFGGEFRVAIDSNRVGCRLEGVALKFEAAFEMVSAGTAPGTVQLPPGGVPIALTAEAPTTGGYPRVAQVIAIDLPHLAQRRPGDIVRFAQTDLADAQMRYLERERALARLESWIRARLRRPW